MKENKKSFGQPGKKAVTNKEKKTRLSPDFSTTLSSPQKKGVTNLRHPSKGNMSSAVDIYPKWPPNTKLQTNYYINLPNSGHNDPVYPP